ncbi:MAG: hypothetical protein ACRDWH_07150 [Acidimicrobiia bacterium]
MGLREGGLVIFGETVVLLTNVDVDPLRHARELRVGVGGVESNVAAEATLRVDSSLVSSP